MTVERANIATSIVEAEAWLCELPARTLRVDATQTFSVQETLFARLTTADSLVGTGYAYTIGTGGRGALAHLEHDLLPQLVGRDARLTEAIWCDLERSTHATTVGVFTSLALAAIDIALWDLRCKRAREPLWVIAGGSKAAVRLYETEGGWLQLSVDELVDGARRALDRGFAGVKIKVGHPDAAEDVRRIAAVREAIGPSAYLMVDANQSLTFADALRRASLFAPYDLFWFEEPLPADDVEGHAALAARASMPIAVGESLYSLTQFGEYLTRRATSVVQVDAARIGGITPWLKVAHLAEAFNAIVAPHFLMELHVSLACAVTGAPLVEHIPQLSMVTTSALEVDEGWARAPSSVGIGIDWDEQQLRAHRIDVSPDTDSSSERT